MIDTSLVRKRLQELTGFSRKKWVSSLFCRVRREDGSWHESAKINVQRGVYGSMSAKDAALAAAAPELHALAGDLCAELEKSRSEIAELKAQLVTQAAVDRSDSDEVGAELDARLTKAGMLTVTQMLGPFTAFQVHAGMSDLAFFEKWLESKVVEYKTMRMRYELGDRDKDDELYEWVLAHSGAYHDVLVNFRAASSYGGAG